MGKLDDPNVRQGQGLLFRHRWASSTENLALDGESSVENREVARLILLAVCWLATVKLEDVDAVVIH
jgi:hypothetical protein